MRKELFPQWDQLSGEMTTKSNDANNFHLMNEADNDVDDSDNRSENQFSCERKILSNSSVMLFFFVV